ncbi:MAG: helix-turn-helix transcriptional regulator [Myxococcaceae bacterium]
MRASRLLQMLLLLQNRGRLNSAQLAAELEVAPRTVLRDFDALTEAGLPIVVHRGTRGGIELGFNYRSRLTGLSKAEAEALGVLLAAPVRALGALGLADAARGARAKLLESLPDGVREVALNAQQQFKFSKPRERQHDTRVTALAAAVRERKRVRILAKSASPRTLHPTALLLRSTGWAVVDGLTNELIPVSKCGDLNVSALGF